MYYYIYFFWSPSKRHYFKDFTFDVVMYPLFETVMVCGRLVSIYHLIRLVCILYTSVYTLKASPNMCFCGRLKEANPYHYQINQRNTYQSNESYDYSVGSIYFIQLVFLLLNSVSEILMFVCSFDNHFDDCLHWSQVSEPTEDFVNPSQVLFDALVSYTKDHIQ